MMKNPAVRIFETKKKKEYMKVWQKGINNDQEKFFYFIFDTKDYETN